MTRLNDLTLTEAAATVRGKKANSVELLDACLAAVDAHETRKARSRRSTKPSLACR